MRALLSDRVIMVAAILEPYHAVDDPAAAHCGMQVWDMHQGDTLERSGQAMKLLDPENVRSLMHRTAGVQWKQQSILQDGQPPYRVSTADSEPHHGAAAAASFDLHRLLALDINELMNHVHRVQRERRTASNVRLVLHEANAAPANFLNMFALVAKHCVQSDMVFV